MWSSALVGTALLTALGALVRWGPRRLPGAPWARQLQMALLAFALAAAFGAWALPRYGPGAVGPWEVGELRADGLRIEPSGRADATAVLDPASFEFPASRELYGIATEIPGVLNQLYCWCGCIDRGLHRSALACYEDWTGASCGICQSTARIAWREVERGITDPARIQAALDEEWAPAAAGAGT